MNDEKPIISSILHVTAKENLNIEDDLAAESLKSIAELLDEQQTKEDNEKTL